jgi:hypothetical protein
MYPANCLLLVNTRTLALTNIINVATAKFDPFYTTTVSIDIIDII